MQAAAAAAKGVGAGAGAGSGGGLRWCGAAVLDRDAGALSRGDSGLSASAGAASTPVSAHLAPPLLAMLRSAALSASGSYAALSAADALLVSASGARPTRVKPSALKRSRASAVMATGRAAASAATAAPGHAVWARGGGAG